MTEKQLKELYLQTEHGVFTPIYEYEDYNAEIETYTNLLIIKTAQEVYDEWLENKDKPVEPQPSTDDKIIVLSKQLCEMELEMMRLRR